MVNRLKSDKKIPLIIFPEKEAPFGITVGNIDRIPDPEIEGETLRMEVDIHDGSRLAEVIKANWSYLTYNTNIPKSVETSNKTQPSSLFQAPIFEED